MWNQVLYLWSAHLAVSIITWMVLIVIIMYFGRQPAHKVLLGLGRSLSHALRLAAKALGLLELQLKRRNDDVLLAAGREQIEKSIEREFSRVQDLVEKDLAKYPSLHRDIKALLTTMEEDYQRSSEDSPLPPAWSQVLDTISAMPSHGDPAVNKVLEHIKSAIESSHQQTLKAYNKAAQMRHQSLSAMQPKWRQVDSKLDRVKLSMDELEARSLTIDKQIEKYEGIQLAKDRALHSLTASSLTQFVIAGLVLVIATLGGLINFQLIALPMSEMVGGSSYIGGLPTSDIAALVIILIEIAMGLFLMESLRITHLFPVISSMDDRMRRRMMWISLSILLILASIESSLAYMRDLLALDRQSLQQTLAGGEVVTAHFRWIPSIGQMVMGFILPFALAFIAIPLESFIHALRTVLGILLVFSVKLASLLLRMAASTIRQLSLVLVSGYDLCIMLPLSIESAIKRYRIQRNQNLTATEAASTDFGPDKLKV